MLMAMLPALCYIYTVLTIFSSETSDWRRGAAQMSVETASCKPGSSSLIGEREGGYNKRPP